MRATTIQIQSLFENSLWRRRRYWTECARPRAQQGWKDGGRRLFECAGNAHTAAPGTGALRRWTFQTGFQFNAETQRTRRSAERRNCNQAFLDCGGKRSATPLWKLSPQPKSGVAAALCHRSPKSSRGSRILTHSIGEMCRLIGGFSAARKYFPLREPLRSLRLCVGEANFSPNRP
jgi:hypothetical protein